MPTEGFIVSSLPNRSLRKHEKEALEAHERLQMVIPDRYVYEQELGEEIIHGVVFIRWDWVTTVVYDANTGWSVSYHSRMEDNILANVALDSRDLYDDLPIQGGMDALPDELTADDRNTATERDTEIVNIKYNKFYKGFDVAV